MINNFLNCKKLNQSRETVFKKLRYDLKTHKHIKYNKEKKKKNMQYRAIYV